MQELARASFTSRFGDLREWIFYTSPNYAVLRAHCVHDASYELDTSGKMISMDCDGGPYLFQGSIHDYGCIQGSFQILEILDVVETIASDHTKMLDIWMRIQQI